MPRELAACVERANLDPAVHVILLSGNGKGFCGGYDLVESAERLGAGVSTRDAPAGSPLDPAVMARNHDPRATWDPMVDYQMMSRNVRGFMSLFHSRQAGRVQGARLLRRRRHRHGAVQRSTRHRGPRQDRLSAGARLGRADDRAVGVAPRPAAGQAPALHRRLPVGHRSGGVGPRDRSAAARRARRALRSAASSASRACRSTSSS